VPAGVQAGERDGVLVGLTAAGGEQSLALIPGCDLGQQLSQAPFGFDGDAGVGVGYMCRLLLYSGDDPGVAMSGIHVHQLRRKVQISLAVGIPEIDAFGLDDGKRLYLPLDGPGEKAILAAQVDDLLSIRAFTPLPGRECHGIRSPLGMHHSQPLLLDCGQAREKDVALDQEPHAPEKVGQEVPSIRARLGIRIRIHESDQGIAPVMRLLGVAFGVKLSAIHRPA
jgi:hypothetical protein